MQPEKPLDLSWVDLEHREEGNNGALRETSLDPGPRAGLSRSSPGHEARLGSVFGRSSNSQENSGVTRRECGYTR